MAKLKDRTGETNINHQGLKMTIIEYRTERDLTIQFEDGTTKNSRYQCFKDGTIRHPAYKMVNVRNQRYKKERLGQVNINYQGCKMKIIEYEDANHMIVEFLDDYHGKVECGWSKFLKGKIKNPNYPSVKGIGITSNLIPIMQNGEKIKEYTVWIGMINRCYCDNSNNRSKSYFNCSIAEEWLFFPNFYNWIISQPNYEKWKNNSGWHLDKDIIKKGNTIYSPEKCCLVPHYINTIFKSTKTRRGSLPIGVGKERNGRYFAQCGNPFTGKNDHLGTYDTPEEAFYAYKKHRELLFKQIAEKEYQQENISIACYEGLMKYNIEIND